MPTYKYRCQDCGKELEMKQHMLDDPLEICPACGGKVSRVIQPPNVIFRGRGFYTTDSKSQIEDLD